MSCWVWLVVAYSMQSACFLVACHEDELWLCEVCLADCLHAHIVVLLSFMLTSPLPLSASFVLPALVLLLVIAVVIGVGGIEVGTVVFVGGVMVLGRCRCCCCARCCCCGCCWCFRSCCGFCGRQCGIALSVGSVFFFQLVIVLDWCSSCRPAFCSFCCSCWGAGWGG